MILDGRAIADELYAALKERRDRLARPVSLGILVGSSDPVIESFVRIKSASAEKLGVTIVRHELPVGASTDAAISAVRELAAATDAVIVQLPLPASLDTDAVLAAVPNEKDVDGINPSVSEHAVVAPVALAVAELLRRGGIDPKGKRAVIVGSGRLVGAPTAALLKARGADVSFFTLDEGSIDDLKDADIIVCGAGNPGFVKPEHVKDGVALIDAGTSEMAGAIRGDADPACAEKAAVFTPVPGGVGPVAVAMIFKNLLDLVDGEEKSNKMAADR